MRRIISVLFVALALSTTLFAAQSGSIDVFCLWSNDEILSSPSTLAMAKEFDVESVLVVDFNPEGPDQVMGAPTFNVARGSLVPSDFSWNGLTVAGDRNGDFHVMKGGSPLFRIPVMYDTDSSVSAGDPAVATVELDASGIMAYHAAFSPEAELETLEIISL